MPIKKAQEHPFESHDALCEAVAERIIDLVRAKPDAVIGLATGGTPEPVYQKIVERYQASLATEHPLDFSHVTFFALDEYVGLAEDHPQSYHHYLWSKLLKPIGADPQLVHIPKGNSSDIYRACSDYEDELKHAGAVDLWIVGIGENGHIAFNEPRSEFTGHTRVVKLTPQTREANKRFFTSLDEVPHYGISVGLGTLRDYAKEVLLLASGPQKAEAIATAMQDRVVQKVPATMLKLMPNVTLYADKDALALHEQQRAMKRY